MSQKGNVDFCPVTMKTWKDREEAKRGDCGGQSVYHCLADNEGRKWERCVEKSLIKEGFCPIFTSNGFIDWKPCNISVPTCPNISYVSNEVYKYSHCFGNNSLHEQIAKNADETSVSGVIVGVVIGLLILLAAVIFMFIYVRRKESSSEEIYMESQTLLPVPKSDEIVEEDNVEKGIALLLRDEVRSIVVLGKFGNSVTSTSLCISKKFQKMMKWKYHECRYTNIPDNVQEHTVMFVYGWFGMWNDDLCSVQNTKNACQSLIRILNTTRSVKLILGMRSDLYKKYYQELNEEDDEQNTSLVHYEINLDSGSDVCKDKEYISYLNTNIKKSCRQNDCPCESLDYKMLRKGGDKVVGMPLKISVIRRYHELIPYYVNNWDISKAMQDHFTILEKNEEKRYVYEWITYICFKGKFCRSDTFDTHLITELNFNIKQSSFDKNDTELSRYVRMRNSDKLRKVSSGNAQYVFWHPFIYICVFRFWFHKDPEFVMKHCNVDAILQLVRPRGFKTSYFEVTADIRCVTLFKERIQELGKEEDYAQHPLMKIEEEEEEEEEEEREEEEVEEEEEEEEEDEDDDEYDEFLFHTQRIMNNEENDCDSS